jgi:3-deoxy-D-arabino-heptulosonate 7-phosphate (DAHP) synthase
MIAGPCSIESKEQIEEVAQMLVSNGIKILRAGAFKPRTSPYSFMGLGEEGLKLLVEFEGLKFFFLSRTCSICAKETPF